MGLDVFVMRLGTNWSVLFAEIRLQLEGLETKDLAGNIGRFCDEIN